MHNKTLLLILGAAMMASGALYAQEPPEDRATFAVQKAYSDDNPQAVDITLSCNTGLPLEQNFSLDPDRTGDTYVEFVVTDFESGTMDCEITEDIPAGYDPDYLYWIDDEEFFSADSCVFEDVEHGETATSNEEVVHNVCFVGNTLLPSEVVVTKEWIDENPQFNAPNFAEATYSCSNLPTVDFDFTLPLLGGGFQLAGGEGGLPPTGGNLQFVGNPGVDSFLTLGNWDGGTECSVTEQLVDSGIETDSSDCDSIVLFPGDSGACTIVNTRLFEGIPTLSQYGLGLLALLMLGMGFVAFRRIA